MFGPELTIWPGIESYLWIFPAWPTFKLSNTFSRNNAKRAGHLFDEIIFLATICHRVQPNEKAAAVREKDVRPTLSDIPKALESFHPWLSGIPGIIHPVKDMVDCAIA